MTLLAKVALKPQRNLNGVQRDVTSAVPDEGGIFKSRATLACKERET